MRELLGLWKFKVRRFRIIYELNRKARVVRVFAIGHRREVYEELADRLRRVGRKKRAWSLVKKVESTMVDLGAWLKQVNT